MKKYEITDIAHTPPLCGISCCAARYNLLKHPNIRYTEDGGAAPYDYTAADNALDDLPGAPENYELLDMDDFLPAEAAEMKPTIQRIRRPK